MPESNRRLTNDEYCLYLGVTRRMNAEIVRRLGFGRRGLIVRALVRRASGSGCEFNGAIGRAAERCRGVPRKAIRRSQAQKTRPRRSEVRCRTGAAGGRLFHPAVRQEAQLTHPAVAPERVSDIGFKIFRAAVAPDDFRRDVARPRTRGAVRTAFAPGFALSERGNGSLSEGQFRQTEEFCRFRRSWPCPASPPRAQCRSG